MHEPTLGPRSPRPIRMPPCGSPRSPLLGSPSRPRATAARSGSCSSSATGSWRAATRSRSTPPATRTPPPSSARSSPRRCRTASGVTPYDARHVSFAFADIEQSGFDLVHDHSGFLAVAFSRYLRRPWSTPSTAPSTTSPTASTSSSRARWATSASASTSSPWRRPAWTGPASPTTPSPSSSGRTRPRRTTTCSPSAACARPRASTTASRPPSGWAASSSWPACCRSRTASTSRTQVEPHIDGEQIVYEGEVERRAQARAVRARAARSSSPSPWPEPFGLVMIEAMACGTPVVAMRQGSVPEVVDDGKTGFVVRHASTSSSRRWAGSARSTRRCAAAASRSASPWSAWSPTTRRSTGACSEVSAGRTRRPAWPGRSHGRATRPGRLPGERGRRSHPAPSLPARRRRRGPGALPGGLRRLRPHQPSLLRPPALRRRRHRRRGRLAGLRGRPRRRHRRAAPRAQADRLALAQPRRHLPRQAPAGHPLARRLPPDRRPGLDAAQQRRLAQGQGRAGHAATTSCATCTSCCSTSCGSPRATTTTPTPSRRAPRAARVEDGAVVCATGVQRRALPPPDRALDVAGRGSRRRRPSPRSRRRSPRWPPAASATSAWSSAAASARRTRTSAAVSGRARELEERGFYFLRYHPGGAKPGDVWDILPEDTQGRGLHFAPFPADLCRIPILATCPPDGVVLDPFCGTGTAMLVARAARPPLGGHRPRRGVPGARAGARHERLARRRAALRREPASKHSDRLARRPRTPCRRVPSLHAATRGRRAGPRRAAPCRQSAGRRRPPRAMEVTSTPCGRRARRRRRPTTGESSATMTSNADVPASMSVRRAKLACNSRRYARTRSEPRECR